MSNGVVTPWNKLADMITAKVRDAKDKTRKAKEQEEQTEFNIRMGAINDALTRPDDPNSAAIIDQSIEQMKKAVPKDTIPILDAYHKVATLVHHKKSGQGKAGQAPGQGGLAGTAQPAPTAQPTSQTPPPGAPAARPGPPLPPGVPQSLGQLATAARPTATQKGEEAGKEQVATSAIVEKAAAKGREDAAQKVRDYYKSKGETIPAALDEALAYETATGKTLPAGFTRPTTVAPPKAPKLVYGPGGQFRGVEVPEDKETNQPGQVYPSRDLIPPDRKDLLKLFDAGKAEQDKEQNAEIDKEHRKNAELAAMIDRRFNESIAASDYKAARKLVNDADKQYQLGVNRVQTMEQAVKDVAEARKNGKENQQAMLNIVANHIGMTTGEQPRMRMNKQQWEEAVQSAPILKRAIAHFDKEGYLAGVVLTDDQMTQMVDLAHEKVDVLKDAVSRIKEEHADELNLSPTVPPSMKKKPDKGQGKGASTKTKEEEEDEKFLHQIK